MLGFPALPGPRSPASPDVLHRLETLQDSPSSKTRSPKTRISTIVEPGGVLHRGCKMHLFTPFHPVLGRTGGIQKTARGSQGSQVKFGRSQSGKVISESPESPESPNVHSSTGEIWRMYENVSSRRNSTYITYSMTKIYTSKRHSKRWPKGVGWCWVGTGDPSCYIVLLLHVATQVFGASEICFRCQNVDVEIPSSEHPPSLQIFKSDSSQVFRCFCLKNKSKPYGILPLHSPRYPI